MNVITTVTINDDDGSMPAASIDDKDRTAAGAAPAPVLDQLLAKFGRSDSAVRIGNRAYVEEMLCQFVGDGSSALQVISDFDRTMSRSHVDGKVCPPSAGVLRNSDLMPAEFRQEAHKLFNHYYPFEASTELSEEEKIPIMIEWYRKSQVATIKTKLSREFLKEVVKKSTSCALRDNMATTLHLLQQHSIPLLIFSAGSGDIIELVLEQRGLLFPNTRVVSNYMEFDPLSGELVGYKEPMVHQYNKNESILGQHICFMDLEHRGNVLLMGDNLADLHMSKGVENQKGILRIGFLNAQVDELLDQFMENFDIVLIDDQSMDFVNILLAYILNDAKIKSD